MPKSAQLALLAFLASLALAVGLKGAKREALISHSGPNYILGDADKGPGVKAREKRWYNNLLVYSRPVTASQAHMLINQHNEYRRQVNAADMQYLFWDENLASQAQRYAEQCNFHHSSVSQRPGAGENIWAAPWSSFEKASYLWFRETWDPRCGCRDRFNHCCGHYTQVVWANSNRMGCGYAECHDIIGAPGRRYVLICQYAPAGNLIGPYGPMQAFTYGTPCSRCPSHAPDCMNGLCVPAGYYRQ